MSPWLALLAIVALVIAYWLFAFDTDPQLRSSAPCAAGGGCVVVRVIDGDTVDMSCPGEGHFRARLINYDTPEIFEPRCAAEAQSGRAATERLRQMVRTASRIDTQLGGYDRYGRRLVRLCLDGRDVGATLVAEGLAHRYNGGRRPDWCALLAERTIKTR